MGVRSDGRGPAARNSLVAGRYNASAAERAHEEERCLMINTSQGLLQRRRDANSTDWRDDAACRDVDPDLFFPLGTSGASLLQIDEAKQICRTCPVCVPCLRWALDTGDAGVWGGTTEDERRDHRQLRAPARATGSG
jgi:WhiB family transcriptional regulator, redox-sensing transcriptional regulator